MQKAQNSFSSKFLLNINNSSFHLTPIKTLLKLVQYIYNCTSLKL